MNLAERIANRILDAMGIDVEDEKNALAVEKWNQACEGIVEELKDSFSIRVEGVETGDQTVYGVVDNE